jgi:hypothetical protein
MIFPSHNIFASNLVAVRLLLNSLHVYLLHGEESGYSRPSYIPAPHSMSFATAPVSIAQLHVSKRAATLTANSWL